MHRFFCQINFHRYNCLKRFKFLYLFVKSELKSTFVGSIAFLFLRSSFMNKFSFRTILLLVAVFGFGVLHAQTLQLKPSVIASQGGNFANSNFEISYTIGELAAVSTITNTGAALTFTQGFHQPDKFSVYVGVNEIDNMVSANLYPNPASDRVYLAIAAGFEKGIVADLFDASGRKIFASQKLSHVAGAQQYEFSIGGLSAGTYLIRLSTIDGTSQKTFRFNKAYF